MRTILRITPLLLLFGTSTLLSAATPRTIPPRVVEEPIWVYPLAADRAGIRYGTVDALLSISRTGELVDFLVLGCSHPAFGNEVLKAVPGYRFAPARIRGEPQPTRMPVTFRFEQGGAMASLLASESLETFLNSRHASESYVSLLCPPGQLDQQLTVRRAVSPRYPEELRNQGVAAEVTVDFFVDGEGRVRLPAVETNAHPSFAREAGAALAEWQFDPPTRNGRPTMVKVEQVFRFPAPAPEPRK